MNQLGLVTSLFADDLLVIDVGGHLAADLRHRAGRDHCGTTVDVSKVHSVGRQVEGGEQIGVGQKHVVRDVVH